MARLVEVEGIGEKYAQKLEEAGIQGTDAFLQMGATKKGRAEIAEKTGISPKLILEWLNHVDLMRVKGIGGEYSDLLEAAGVDTVAELAQRNPENLLKALEDVNQKKKLVRKMPTLAQVTDWVDQAAKLPKILTY